MRFVYRSAKTSQYNFFDVMKNNCIYEIAASSITAVNGYSVIVHQTKRSSPGIIGIEDMVDG